MFGRARNKRSWKRPNRKVREPFVRRFARRAFVVLGGLAFGSAAIAVSIAGWWVYDEVRMSPYLRVRTIVVRGAQRVSGDEVKRLSGVYVGKGILSVSPTEAEGAVKTHPFVEDARLTRRLPGEIDIDIKEREPVAVVRLNGLFVMDGNGVFFKEYSAGDGLDLPVITGAEALKEGWDNGVKKDLLAFLEILRHSERFNPDNISEIHVDAVYGFSLVTLKEGIRLEFGRGGLERKFNNLEKVMQARGGNTLGMESVDLTSDRGVIVRFSTGVVKEGGVT
ncbi:MAG: FtsQ-type POTRA domain-containing protein [Deltaproteobacteria bacterium]|nr:FtsQ-type POTRA domain-containing protein [Deltaproteobacteria bacterium]